MLPSSYRLLPDRAARVQTAPADQTVTALLCTCDRGVRLIAAVESILANEHPSFELVIVDQSRGNETARAVQPYLSDPRLRFLQTQRRGLGYARNVGTAAARAEIVAMTDDDCRVPVDWLAGMAAIFREHPEVAVVFCGVDAVPHDPTFGFVPTFFTPEERLLRSLADFRAPHGIGAGMAIRRSVLSHLGGFDAETGAGARFSSYEDADIALRALLAGYAVAHTRRVAVLHDGFRTWEEGRQLVRRDFFGTGAVHAKLLRCAGPRMVPVIARILRSDLLDPVLTALAHRKRPRVGLRAASYARGFAAGICHPTDRALGRFAEPRLGGTPQETNTDARPGASLALPDR